MDSETSSKLNDLKAELTKLQMRETTLNQELESVRARISVKKKEIANIVEYGSFTQEILEQVYSQRRGKIKRSVIEDQT